MISIQPQYLPALAQSRLLRRQLAQNAHRPGSNPYGQTPVVVVLTDARPAAVRVTTRS